MEVAWKEFAGARLELRVSIVLEVSRFSPRMDPVAAPVNVLVEEFASVASVGVLPDGLATVATANILDARTDAPGMATVVRTESVDALRDSRELRARSITGRTVRPTVTDWALVIPVYSVQRNAESASAIPPAKVLATNATNRQDQSTTPRVTQTVLSVAAAGVSALATESAFAI